MSVVMYFGTNEKEGHKVDGLVNEDASVYVEQEDTEKAVGLIDGLIETLVEEGYAEKETDKGEFYVRSTSNDSYVGFIIVYNGENKELDYITVDNNGDTRLVIVEEDIDTFLTNEDYMFPIFETLTIVQE